MIDKTIETVSELASSIADEIEERGHYRGSEQIGLRAACVIVNDTWQTAPFEVREQFTDVLGTRLGFERLGELDGSFDYEDIYKWNDSTATPEVVATLRTIAEESS